MIACISEYFQVLISGALYGPVGYELLEVAPGSWRQFARSNLRKMLRLPQGRDYYRDTFEASVERVPQEQRSMAVALVYELGTAMLRNDFGSCVEALPVRFESTAG